MLSYVRNHHTRLPFCCPFSSTSSAAQNIKKKVNGGTPHFSRRRRKGGSGRRIPGDPPNASTSSAGRGGNVSSGNGAIVVTAGGGRGGGRRTIWEDNTATGRPGTTAKLSDDHDGQPSAVSRTGGASAGGDMQGSRAGGGVGVHPAMLESEFLAATGAAEAGEEGGAVSLSLEEVPYDRDVRCVWASDFFLCAVTASVFWLASSYRHAVVVPHA